MTISTLSLPTGTLTLKTECDALLTDHYLGFGARSNLKRSFLFVSKVLGKHWPAKPSLMKQAQCELAHKLQDLGPSDYPLLFIGMAETAVGLGHGIFEAYLEAHPEAENQALFVQTTRYKVKETDYLIFDEAHSHAPKQFLHLPQDPSLRHLFQSAKTLILIDDEISTGNTFINLSKSCDLFCPHLQAIHLLSLTDLSGERRDQLAMRFPHPLKNHALITGSFEFSANGCLPDIPQSAQVALEETPYAPQTNYGRCGIAHLIKPDSESLHNIIQNIIQTVHTQPKAKILILGTGEFMHIAFVIALALEKTLNQNRYPVSVQSTTRSPILIWGDISHKRCFTDHYGENINNYLYNVPDHTYDHIFICHETVINDNLKQLARQLNGQLLSF